MAKVTFERGHELYKFIRQQPFYNQYKDIMEKSLVSPLVNASDNIIGFKGDWKNLKGFVEFLKNLEFLKKKRGKHE